jgi:hypothetical protein
MGQNTIDANGITIQTYTEILNDITNGTDSTPGWITIYGSDINLDSNSPDGQIVNLMALSKEDMLQFGVGIYNAFNPDLAVGQALDGVAQYNGITRKGGTYTQTQVVVTTNQSVTLNGNDQSASTPFTIEDGNGNQLYLITTVTIGSGTSTLNFQAANMGFVQIVQNTVTAIVTPQTGVLAVNNPSTPYNYGADQETDAQFRLRRQQSTAGLSTHKAQALYTALNNIVGVEQAVVYENNTGVSNSIGLGAHSIWVIVEGGTAQEIANMIYNYVDCCGMKGSTEVDIVQPVDGSLYPVYFDIAQQQVLQISLNIESLSGSAINNAAIQSYLLDNYTLGINEVADITSITALVRAYSSDLLVTFAGVSISAGSYTDSVKPSAVINYFVLLTGNILITNT